MVKYLLDSNTVFAMFRDRNDVSGIRRSILKAGMDKCAISELTVAETYSGYFKDGTERHRYEPEFLKSNFTVIPVSTDDDRIIRKYGEIKANLEQKGLPVPDIDLLIASTAIANSLICVSHDKRHFPTIPGLLLEDWLTSFPSGSGH